MPSFSRWIARRYRTEFLPNRETRIPDDETELKTLALRIQYDADWPRDDDTLVNILAHLDAREANVSTQIVFLRAWLEYMGKFFRRVPLSDLQALVARVQQLHPYLPADQRANFETVCQDIMKMERWHFVQGSFQNGVNWGK